MKINKNVEAIIVTLLYLSCLWLWTLPFQENKLPYGEVDASSHFAVADYITETDKSITVLPYYIDYRYGKDNDYKNHYLWYHPPYHVAFSIAQIIGGERIVPVFLANAIFASLTLFAVYFVIRKLFGFMPAILSGFLLMFSMRDIMVYLWGQWPERMGFAYLPLVIYCFYKYITSYSDKQENPVYLYIMSLLLVANLFIHPMTFIHTVLTLVILFVFMVMKERKIFFNIKHVLAGVFLFLFLVSLFPTQTLNVVVRLKPGEDVGAISNDFSRLFSWTKGLSLEGAVPDSYFSYKQMVAPYWTLPFIFLGIFFIISRRNKKDFVLIAWLIGLYIMTHLDVIGKGGRVHRSLSATGHIFYPLMVLGLLYLLSYAKYFKNYKNYLKFGGIVLFVLLIVFSNGKTAYSQLKGAYGGIVRITPYQAEAAEWIKLNTPEDANIYPFGTLMMAKSRWMWMLSHRHIKFRNNFDLADLEEVNYILMDYSDRLLMNDQNTLNAMQAWENANLANSTLLYDKNYIKVYEFEI